MSWLILLIVLILLLGALPAWPHSRSWGYFPSGGLGLVLVVLLVLALMAGSSPNSPAHKPSCSVGVPESFAEAGNYFRVGSPISEIRNAHRGYVASMRVPEPSAR